MGGIVVVVVGGAVASVDGASGFDDVGSAESFPPPPQPASHSADSTVAHAVARIQRCVNTPNPSTRQRSEAMPRKAIRLAG
jgi:hypothetical protein